MTSRRSFLRAITPTLTLPSVFSQNGAQHASYQQVKTEEDHQFNPNENLPHPPSRKRTSPFAGFSHLIAQCNRRLLLTTLGLLAFLLLITSFLPSSRLQAKSALDQADHRLHLLIPSSNHPDIGFCKTQLTAAILGYPTPLILNREDSGRGAAEKERTKIRVTNNHLNDLEDDHSEDLVILLDGAHSWFQLRPEVLADRYYKINERANERLKAQAGNEGSPVQRIVFAAQNHCSEATLDKVACFAPPASPLDTESNLRFLNSGLAVGPVKDMRKLLNRVNGKSIARQSDDITQQGLLAEIFGEQEFRREYLRQGSWSSGKRKLDSALKALGYSKAKLSTDSASARRLLGRPDSAEYEMGIGLDYGNELGLSVSRSTSRDDVEWIRYGPTYKQTPSVLPKDIATSMPPFWTTTSAHNLPIENGWSDVPLLTSTRTGGIPAIIDVPGGKRGGADWSSLWIQPHVRELWEAQKEVSRLPLMSVLDGNGTQRTFWNQELRMDRDGANWIEGGWKSWTDHCGWDEGGDVVRVGDDLLGGSNGR